MVQNNVRNGKFPSIGQEILSTYSAMELSIYKAMKMCHVFDFRKRSTAADVESFLRKEMMKFNVPFFDDGN